MSRTALWIGSVLGAAALGWAAAMYVQAGAPLGNEEDTYIRFGNALRTPEALERTETLVKLTKQLTPETLPGAIRAYREDLYPLDAVDLRILMAYWAKQAPREMLTEVSSWSDNRVQHLAAAQGIAQVAKHSGYDAARTLYDDMPTHMRSAGLPNLVIGMIDYGELDDLAGFITSFEGPDERELVANIAMHQMIRAHGPNVVQTWIEGLPPGRGSSNDLQRVGFRAAQSAHLDNGYRDEFIEWAERSKDKRWSTGVWRSIAVHWVRTDPMAGIEWAKSLPEDCGRDDVVAEAIRIWTVRDAEKALEWILPQDPNPELDRGTGRLAVHHAIEKPSVSLAMMERIVAPETYANTRRSVEHRWNVLPNKRKAELLKRTKELSVARRKKTLSEQG
ncbi:MAG: hypothetical protein AB8G23_11980 [Myxococcota bacterium]